MIEVFGELLSSINSDQAGRATEGLVQQRFAAMVADEQILNNRNSNLH
jgi:hypothetical protein